jgi:ABC-2 type transport system ATP-binding protein
MDEAELCDTLGFIYQGRLIAEGSPQRIKTEAFHGAVIELETGDLRAAADALSDWDAVEEIVRVGVRLRLLVGVAAASAASVRAFLAARGIALTWAREVEPSVEDLFVSFVDKERKDRVRQQLRALAADPTALETRA